ncbi:MAG: HlyD family secretion protein [Epsilonproteobacteria bacterium]|nr:HlyD family secretion protein [Campylobacterota bacterium]
MKYLLILFTPLFLLAKVHYAKVEPYEHITLKAAVSAQVTKSKTSLEGKNINNDTIIELDSKLDKVDLSSSQESLKLIKNMITTNQTILSALKESLNRQEGYYSRISNIASASKTQKDNAFYGYINAKTQYFSTKEKLDSLKKQHLDMLYKIELLKDQISKKTIKLNNKFLYKLMVNQGDFVNPGTALAQIKDLSRAKLVLFLEAEELKDIKSKTIYINDKATEYKISKVWSVADEKFISSYRTEIIIDDAKNNFSKLLKVEFK